MRDGIRWVVSERYGNTIYLTEERWHHMIEPFNHPEMIDNEEELKQTIRLGRRKIDILKKPPVSDILSLAVYTPTANELIPITSLRSAALAVA